VQEKAISHPTDSRLLEVAREKIARLAKRAGIQLKQTHERDGKALRHQVGRDPHPLTDNSREFTDRLFGSKAKDASGQHAFDALCEALGIEHRLTRPKSPQTSGMVERFNGRLEQMLRSHRFNSAHDLITTLHRYV